MGKGQYTRKPREAKHTCSVCKKTFKNAKCARNHEAMHEARDAISAPEKQEEADLRLLMKSLTRRFLQMEQELMELIK